MHAIIPAVCILWLQVSEAELEAIARMGDSVAELEEAAAAGPGGDATRALMGQYGQTPAK
jgi:pre-mRNA-splicing factor CDC5/CEF1